MPRKPRTVFTKDEIAHVFVNNRYHNGKEYVTVTEGRTASYTGGRFMNAYNDRAGERINGNQSFKDDKFYSYRSQVAQRYDLGDKGIVYLVYAGHNTPTTKGQVRDLLRAIPREKDGRKVSKFEFSHNERGYIFWPKDAEDRERWEQVYDYYVEQSRKHIKNALRARKYRGLELGQATTYRSLAANFAALFELSDHGGLESLRDEIAAVPDYVAKEPDPNRRQYIRDWGKAAELVSNLPMIAVKAIRGETYELVGQTGVRLENGTLGIKLDEKRTLSLSLRKCPWATIRVIGEQVVTSRGVRMSKAEATVLYEGMLRVIAQFTKNNYPGANIGGYWIKYEGFKGWKSDVLSYGYVAVGCHHFHPSTLASDFLYLIKS